MEMVSVMQVFQIALRCRSNSKFCSSLYCMITWKFLFSAMEMKTFWGASARAIFLRRGMSKVFGFWETFPPIAPAGKPPIKRQSLNTLQATFGNNR